MPDPNDVSMIQTGCPWLSSQSKVIFGHLESIFVFSQSLGKRQKMPQIGMVGLLEQYKVIFGHLESIFAFSQSLGKKQKCLRLAWMNWNIIISKLEGIFSICKSSLIRVQYCI